jgi:polysaccharide pyruvyl transferase WcaK-like protein
MTKIIHFHFNTRTNVGDAAHVAAIQECLGMVLDRPRWTSMPMRRLKREARTTALLRRINQHDLMIVGGGGLYAKWALPLNARLITEIDIPIVIFGVGYNRNLGDPPLTQAQLDSIAVLNGKASLCAVRDEPSQQFLSNLGFEATLSGDPALFLRSKKTRLHLENKLRIGINLAAHGWHGQEVYLDRVVEACVDAIDKLRQKHALQLFYLMHTPKEADVARRLKKRLPGLRICRLSAPKLLYVYEQLDLVMAMMLHAAIFAYAAHTPVVNMAYDEKNRAFMTLIGHADRLIDVREISVDQLVQAAVSALDSQPADTDVDCRQALLTRTSAFVAQVADLVGRRAVFPG